MGNALDVSLDNSAFLSKWTDGKFSASERHIYITKWAGDAFDALVGSKRISKYFLKTGCLLRDDGGPNPIHIQGLPDYAFPSRCQQSLITNIDSSDSESDESDNPDFESASEDEYDHMSSDEDVVVIVD